MAKAKRKTVTNTIKVKDAREFKKLQKILMKKIDEDSDYECGCGTPHSIAGWAPVIAVPPRDPRLGAPYPVFGPSLFAHERRYKIQIERLARQGAWGDEVNYDHHIRAHNVVASIIQAFQRVWYGR